MKTTVYRKIFAVFLFAACLVQPLSATDYYVKADGNNGDTGLSLDHAFATIAKAVTISKDNDVIYISGEIIEPAKANINGKILTFRGINNALVKPTGNVCAMGVAANSQVRIESVEFTGGNRTQGSGGILTNDKSVLELVNCYFHDNLAAKGGAIYSSSGDIFIRNCVFKSNTGSSYGGALCIDGAEFVEAKSTQTVYIEGSSFINNSGNNGTGILLYNSASTTFTAVNTTISQNTGATALTTWGEQASSTFTLRNVTITKNVCGGNGAFSIWGNNTTFSGAVKIYNSIIAGNVDTNEAEVNNVRVRTGTGSGGTFDIKNSIIGIYTINNGIINISTIANSTMETGADPGLADFNSTYNAYPLASSSSLAYGFGDANLLAELGYHTDQLKQYRSFANDKCHAGAAEWVLGDDIVPTTSITATEIGGYSGGSLEDKTGTLTFTDTYSLDNLSQVQNALVENQTITALVFEEELPDEITGDYFAAINPNALKHIVDEQAPGNWTNVVSTTGFLTPLSLTDGFPHDYTDVDLSGIPGFNYTRTVTPKQWYPMGFPFKLSNVIGYMSNGDLKNQLEVYNGSNDNDGSGDFWVKTYDGNASFAYSASIEEDESYIIQFPTSFEDAKVSFVSDENPYITGTYTPPADGYVLVSNPSIENLELNAEDRSYIYNPETNAFNLLENEETATIKPFEAFIVAGTNVESPLKSISVVNATTGLNSIQTGDPVIDTSYYTLQGVQVAQPVENGIYIRKKTHASKRVSASKIIYRKY
jgi:hypothetical protein